MLTTYTFGIVQSISKTQPSSTKAVICLHFTSATKKVECRPIVCYQYWTTNYIVILEVKGIPGRYDTPFCCCTSCTQCSRHLMYCLNTLESNGWLYSIQDVMPHFSNTIEITIDVITTSLIHTHITKCTVENLSTRCMAQIGEARLGFLVLMSSGTTTTDANSIIWSFLKLSLVVSKSYKNSSTSPSSELTSEVSLSNEFGIYMSAISTVCSSVVQLSFSATECLV